MPFPLWDSVSILLNTGPELYWRFSKNFKRILTLHVKGSALLGNWVQQTLNQFPYCRASQNLKYAHWWCKSPTVAKVSISHPIFAQEPPSPTFLKKYVELVAVRTHLRNCWIRWFSRLFQPHSLILYGPCHVYLLFLRDEWLPGSVLKCSPKEKQTHLNAYEVT